MTKLGFSEKSIADLEEILEFIARDKPGAAVRFVDRLQQQCESLAQFPELGMRRDDLAAELRLFSFRGYGIYFRNLGDRVRIGRVLHGALDVQSGRFE